MKSGEKNTFLESETVQIKVIVNGKEHEYLASSEAELILTIIEPNAKYEFPIKTSGE